MSISSVAPSAPVTPVASAPAAPDSNSDNGASDDAAAEPAVVAPLPPGQGTRIDQIV